MYRVMWTLARSWTRATRPPGSEHTVTIALPVPIPGLHPDRLRHPETRCAGCGGYLVWQTRERGGTDDNPQDGAWVHTYTCGECHDPFTGEIIGGCANFSAHLGCPGITPAPCPHDPTRAVINLASPCAGLYSECGGSCHTENPWGADE